MNIVRLLRMPHCITSTVRVLVTAGMNMVQLLPYCITVRVLAITGVITARVLAIVGVITVCILVTVGMYIVVWVLPHCITVRVLATAGMNMLRISRNPRTHDCIIRIDTEQ